MDVAQNLNHADQEMLTAIDAFKRASRMRLFEIFRSANTDPMRQGAEEVHVKYGLTALLNAERHVAAAAANLDDLPERHPVRRNFGRSVTALDESFRRMLLGMRDQPNPRHIVAQLKRARKSIPVAAVARELGKA